MTHNSPQMQPGSITLQRAHVSGTTDWLCFNTPVRVIQAVSLAEVLPALRQVEDGLAAGLHAAGFLSYEASPAFDEALVTHARASLPLLWFGLYASVEAVPTLPFACDTPYSVSPWQAAETPESYHAAIARIKAYIAAGDTYQVNHTLRLHADFAGDVRAFFATLCRAQQARYGAYVDTGEHVLCSVSPELFFTLDGSTITCRPMKGTTARGLTTITDRAQAEWLRHSAKNRAENVMIVDMLRNDLGRIAAPGSVQVTNLFDTERYETLWQMTSTVTATTRGSFSDILRALFPCASITGAPKVRTMQIIRELETAPRGIYTGCIGYISPQRQAQFNVAIRTMHIDRTTGRAEYGTGGGIVWDSDAESELAETRTKALVLTADRPVFSLLETLKWIPGGGYDLLDYHLERLEESARYFGFPVNPAVVETTLANAAEFFTEPMRVRLLLDEKGKLTASSTALNLPNAPRTWKVALAKNPVDISDRFLYHKTTHRAVYDAARAQFPDHDDVLLWNAWGEITESTIANLVARIGGKLVTPPVSSGLLAGTLRAQLLERREIMERVVTLDDLRRADAVYLINSLRGWIPAEIDWSTLPSTLLSAAR